MNLKDHIFNFFGVQEKRIDINKDEEGRGTYERYQRTLYEEFDQNENAKLDSFTSDLINPKTMISTLLPYLEQTFGDQLRVIDDLTFRRKVMGFMVHLNQLVGTLKGYEVVLHLLGFTNVEIVDLGDEKGFDSDITLDDAQRRFDSNTITLIPYGLNITGTLPNDASTHQLIREAIKFVEPINAELREIYYNGQAVNIGAIAMYLADGDLVYDNENNPDLEAAISENGDLIFTGTGSDSYHIDENGDLIYTSSS